MSLQLSLDDASPSLSKAQSTTMRNVKERYAPGDWVVEIEPSVASPGRLVSRYVAPGRHRGGGRRGAIVRLTPAAARQFERAVARTVTGGRVWYTATLTVAPSFVGDFRPCCAKMTRWLGEHGYTGYWILHRHRSGLPHAHLAVLIPLEGHDETRLKNQWTKITGCTEPIHKLRGLWLDPARSVIAYARYAAASAQKDGAPIPGKQWGRFGKPVLLPNRVVVASGQDQAVIQLTRILFRAEVAARRKRGKTRPRRRGFGFFRSFLSVQGILDRLPDLLELLDLPRDVEQSLASLQRLIQSRQED